MAVYVNGVTVGTAGGNPSPSPRGEVVEWSRAAVRRHTRWLYAVDSGALVGTGIAATLTMRDIPEDHEAFHNARRRLLKRVERLGLVRAHWVVEWTRARRPHLHMALYFAPDLPPDEVARLSSAVVAAWLAVAGRWGTEVWGQATMPIAGALGWLQYLSKHAARGVDHYQRQGRPPGWEKTGRLWGYTGEWPVADPMKLELSRRAFWELRRLVRAWRVADARAALAHAYGANQRKAALRRLRSARRMLSCGDRRLSEVRGISEWAPEEVVGLLTVLLVARGHTVHQS